MVTFGTPHMGVAKIPQCFEGFICDMINDFAKTLVYYGLVQNFFGPAGYFRDPSALDDYKENSVFLPYVNNEVQSDVSKLNISRFKQLKKAMLVKFTEDSMIFPRESAWFWEA